MKLATKIFRRSDWYVTSPFGMRKDPFTKKRSKHNGTDYGTHAKKWPLYAVEDGYVVSTGKSKTGYGNRVWVRYPRINRSLLYAHLDSIKVKKGDKVNEKTIVGYTGKTGKATGIHLHLGMTKIGSDTWLDPHAYNYEQNTGNNKFNIAKPVNRDEKKNQVKVLVTQLRCRKEPNLKGVILGFVQNEKYYNYSEIKVSDGYTWYKIGNEQWIANNGKYLEILEQKKPIEKPKPTGLKIGDKVKITGYGSASSNGTGSKAGGIGWERKILKIYKGRKFPYQVGDSTGTTGFYKENSLKKI